MIIQVLKSKIHRVTVTEADVNYIGSITIDPILLEAANMIEGERVQVLNCANGERLETYIILGERGSGVICLNGPAALKCTIGDIVIVCSYAQMDFEEAAILWPKIQEFVKTHNRQPNINSIIETEKRMAECIIYLKEERRKKAANNDK